MHKLESIKLFRDLQDISLKYNDLELNISKNEFNANKKMQELILNYRSQIKQIKEKYNSISTKIREQSQSNNSSDTYNTIIKLTNLSKDKCNYIKNSDMNFEHICVKSMLLKTVDEISLISDSIRNKDFLEDEHAYFYIYEEFIMNCFINLFILKDMGIQISKMEALSQAVISQIQTLSLISIYI